MQEELKCQKCQGRLEKKEPFLICKVCGSTFRMKPKVDKVIQSTNFSRLNHENSNEKLNINYDEKNKIYQKGIDFINERNYIDAIELFTSIISFSDSRKKIDECKQNIYSTASLYMKNEKYNEAGALFDYLKYYADSHIKAEQCRKMINSSEKANIYSTALDRIKHKPNEKKYIQSINDLESIKDYKDSYIQIFKIKNELEEWKKAKRAKKILTIGAIGLSVVLSVFIVLLSTVIIPSNKYEKAKKLYAEGYFNESQEIFKSIINYKDSKKYERICYVTIQIVENENQDYNSLVVELLSHNIASSLNYLQNDIEIKTDNFSSKTEFSSYRDISEFSIESGFDYYYNFWYSYDIYNDTSFKFLFNVCKNVKQFNISYDLNGGSLETENPTTYNTLTEDIILQNPTKLGYNFLGWLGTDIYEKSLNVVINKGSVGDREFVAHWEIVNYNISYNLNGGKLENENPSTYTIEDEIVLSNPTKKGYNFAGWTGTDLLENTINVKINKGSVGNKEFIANWEEENYTISYDLKGGSAINPATYTIEDEIVLSNPTKKGYSFVGWFGTGLTKETMVVKIEKGSIGNRSYYAIWEEIRYNITYYLNGGEAVNLSTYTIEDEVILSNPTKVGYAFTGWIGTEIENNSFDVVINKGSTGDREFTATWNINNYIISYKLNGGSVINPSSYTILDEITLTNPIKSGYKFTGWTGTGIQEKSLNVVIKKGSVGERNYTAHWEIINYSITYDLNNGELDNENPTVYTVEDEITLSNPTRKGFTFTGWVGTDLEEKTMLVVINKGSIGDRTYLATWSNIEYKITYNLDGGSAENPNSYTILDEFTLKNPTKTGYEFAGWIGTDIELPILNVVILEGSIGDREYSALWTPLIYQITYELNGGTYSENNRTSYTVEDEFTLNNPTKYGYNFVGWTGTDIQENTLNVVINKGSIGDREYTANFKAISYQITYNLDGGILEETNPTSYTIEEEITLINPTKEGYIFLGWTGTDLLETTLSVVINKGSAGDREYTACWEVLEYSITYNLDGGKANNPTSYTVFDEITLTNPTKKGCVFSGWTGTDLSGSSYNVVIQKGSKGDREYTATWKYLSYNITYNLDGGSVVNPSSYTILDEITLSNPTKKGYTFIGWTGTDIEESSLNVVINKGSTGDREFTAIWQINTYTISYNLNGGTTEGINPTTYTVLDEITLINPTKEGHTFVGWIGTDLSSETLIVNIKNATENREYTAVWQEDVYEIIYYLDGGNAENPSSYTLSDEIVINNPTKIGYEFIGWTGTDLEEATLNVVITKGSIGNREYTAHWEIVEYNISYELNDGSAENPTSYTIEDTITLINPTKLGYNFVGWTGTDILENTLSVVIEKGNTGDKHYVANWEIESYTINYILDGGSTEGVNPTTYNIYDEITLINPTKIGYEFIGWTGTDLDETTLNVIISIGSTGYREYVANYKPISYSIVYNLDGGITANPSTYTVEDTILLTAPTKDGYTFKGWTGTNLSEITLNVNINSGSIGDREYTAHWEIETYTISYTLNDSIINGTNPTTYTINDSFVLINPTKLGYIFTGWTGTDLSDRSVYVEIKQGSFGNREYVANWQIDTYEITYNLGGGTSQNPNYYNIESQITLSNPVKDGYNFIGWTGTDLTETTLNVVINKGSVGDREYTAVWEVISYEITYNLDGGTASNPMSYTIEDEITLSTPTKNGYTFKGWSGTNISGKTESVVIQKGTTGNLEYTANWEIETYTILYNLNDGIAYNPNSYTAEDDDFTLENPTKEGYTFTGWTGTDLSGETLIVKIEKGSTGDREYTANFKAISYNITYNLNGGKLENENPSTYTIEDTIILENPTREGYTFKGWSGTDISGTLTYVVIGKYYTGDREYTANWEIIYYKLDTPTNLTLSQEDTSITISWDSVENAKTYYLKIGDLYIYSEYSQTYINFNISAFNGETSIVVSLKANGYDNYLDSDEVSETFGIKTKLNAPIINSVSIVDDKIILNATVHTNDKIIDLYSLGGQVEIGLDNESVDIDITSYLTESKTYEITIKSLSYDDYTIDSDLSNTYYYKNILPFPSPEFTNISMTEDITGIYLAWTLVEGASEYNLYVNDELFACISSTSTTINLTDISELESGGYNFNIQAKGNDDYLDSILGPNTFFENPYKLTVPKNIRITSHEQGFLVEWDEVLVATHYTVAVDNNLFTTTTESFIYQTEELIPYQVMVKAHKDSESTEFSEKHMYNNLDLTISGYTDKYVYFSGWQDFYANTLNEFITLCKYAFFSYDYSETLCQIYLNSELGITEDNFQTYFSEAANHFGTMSISYGYYIDSNVLYLQIVYRDGTETPPTESTTTDRVMMEEQGYYRAENPTRSSDYNDFATETSLIEVEVSDTNELYICAEGRAKPIFTAENYRAEESYLKAKEVLRTIISDDMTELQKTLAIYDYIEHFSVYDSDNENDIIGDPKYWLNGPLLSGIGVCDGFSKLFSLLCNMEGIEAVKINGNAVYDDGTTVGHAWNKVKLDLDGDGIKEWYLVDITWDGIVYNKDSIKYELSYHKNFLLTDEEFTNRVADDDYWPTTVDVNFYELFDIDSNGNDLYITSNSELLAYFEFLNNNTEMFNYYDVYIDMEDTSYLTTLLSLYGASYIKSGNYYWIAIL